MAVKVGIPRTLSYYTYHPMWKTFLEELGAEVVVSNWTTREILDQGVKEAVSEACVPIKLFHGHVMDLLGKVDLLFIPRLVSTRGRKVFCPKFLGLPDMVRYSIENLPPLIDVRVDLRNGRRELWRVCCRVAEYFGGGFLRTLRAYLKSLKALARFERLLRSGLTAPEAIKAWGRGMDASDVISTGRGKQCKPDLRFAVLGYPYEIYDPFVSVDLVGKLRELGVEVVTSEMLAPEVLRRQSARLGKELFWMYSDEALKAAYHFFEYGGVDGIIHVTAFGCGPDSMVDKMMELEAKRCRQIPFMSLMIDEHTGDAGVRTRLEAFVDMVRRHERSLPGGGGPN